MEGVISAIEVSVSGGVETQDASAAYSACEKVCQLTSILYYNVIHICMYLFNLCFHIDIRCRAAQPIQGGPAAVRLARLLCQLSVSLTLTPT